MKRVVIVEDEPALRRGLAGAVPWEAYGCVVIGEAANGIAGEELIRRIRPDIVITDIRMPGCSGIEMIGQLKDLEGIEYVIISGHADFAYAQAALAFGVKGYVLKPVDEEQLKDAVLRAVEALDRRRRGKTVPLQVAQSAAGAPGAARPGTARSGIAMPAAGEVVDYRERQLSQVLRVIEEHYAEALTAGEIAEFLEMSESTLSHMFRTRTGYTFLQYLTNHRLKKAAELLAREQYHVGKVAAMVGYQDFRHFCELFKRSYGVTPHQFRKGLAADPLPRLRLDHD
jgi:two-component system, response regulator YesN